MIFEGVARCGELLQLRSDTCECVFYVGGDEGMTLLNSCQVLKSLACVLLWHLQLIAQLNRFLALQALVEGLGIWRATFGLKFPILLNWVRFRPGIVMVEQLHLQGEEPLIGLPLKGV